MGHHVGRALAIAAIVGVVLLSLILSTRLRMDEDIVSLLPADDPAVSDHIAILKQFHALDALYIDIGACPPDGGRAGVSPSDPASGTGSYDEIVAVADELNRQLEKSGLFAQIHYRFPPDKLLGVLKTLSDHKQSLFSERDVKAAENHLDVQAVNARIAAARRALLEPSGSFTKEQVQQDPLGFDEIALAKLEDLAREGGPSSIVDGRIRSADQKHVFMAAVTDFPATDSRKSAAVATALAEARREALAKARKGAVRIACAGGHLSAVENAGAIKGDLFRTLLANAIGLAVLGLLAHRRKIFIAIVFLPALFGMACATIVFGIFDPLISAIVIGCGTVLVTVTVDYDFQILYRIDNMDPQALAPQNCVRGMLLQIAAAAGATATAFLCLALSSLPGQRQMGYFACLGVVGSAAFSLVGLVYLIPRVQKLRWQWVIPLKDVCAAFLAWRDRHRRPVIAAGFLLLIASACGVARLRFEGDVSKLNYAGPARQEEEQRLTTVWGGAPSVSAMVQGKTLEEALQANDRLAAVLCALRDEGRVRQFTSVAALVPSKQTQEANARRWRDFWTEERRTQMQDRMSSAMAAAGFSPTAFQRFYAGLDARETPLTVRDFENTSLAGLVRSHVTTSDGKWFALTTLSPAAGADLSAVTARLRSAVPTATVSAGRQFVEHVAGLARTELRRLALVASLAALVVLYLFFGRVELVLAVSLPVWLSAVFTLGILGWADQPINLISSLFIIFVFGIGIHYSIALVTNAMAVYNGNGVDDSIAHGGVLVCALLSVLSFGSLTFARHPTLFSIGLAGLLGVLSSLFSTVLVVPLIMKRLLPERGRYGTPSLKTWGGMLWAIVYVVGVSALYSWVIRYFILLRHRNNPVARQQFARWYLHRTAAALLKCFPYRDSKRIFIDADAAAFVPPGIIVSNHASAFDIIVILALPAPMAMMVKRWVWRFPIMGRMVRDAGYIMVDDHTADELMARGSQCLDEGVCIMVFPEGSRSPDGRMRRFHKGAFELAVRTGRDVIPVLLTDTQSCLPRHATWVGDHQSVIRVLPRVTPRSFDYALGSRALADHTKALMLRHADEDWRLAQDGKAFWHNIRMLYNYRGPYVENYIAWKLRLDPIYRQIDALVPLCGTVLDLGCGYGLMSNILARKSLSRRVVGVDFDEGKIAVARGSVIGARVSPSEPNVTIEAHNILSWDFPPADCVLLIDTLHYWSAERQRRVIEKAAACLRSGGRLIVREACAERTVKHGLTAWAEKFGVILRRNRAGDGLVFMGRDFYLNAFEHAGLRREQTACRAPGSNEVFVLEKRASEL